MLSNDSNKICETNVCNSMKKIENFFAQVSTFPLNIEIGILQIGH